MSNNLVKLGSFAVIATMLAATPVFAKDTAMNNSGPMTKESEKVEQLKQLTPEQQKEAEKLRAIIKQKREEMMQAMRNLHDLTGKPVPPYGKRNWGNKSVDEDTHSKKPSEASDTPMPPVD